MTERQRYTFFIGKGVAGQAEQVAAKRSIRRGRLGSGPAPTARKGYSDTAVRAACSVHALAQRSHDARCSVAVITVGAGPLQADRYFQRLWYELR